MSVDITNKEGRELCWSSRDKFWKCLDKQGEDASKCQAERKNFERDCTKTWVTFFFNYLRKKDQQIFHERSVSNFFLSWIIIKSLLAFLWSFMIFIFSKKNFFSILSYSKNWSKNGITNFFFKIIHEILMIFFSGYIFFCKIIKLI
jgi:hypothetical protein